MGVLCVSYQLLPCLHVCLFFRLAAVVVASHRHPRLSQARRQRLRRRPHRPRLRRRLRHLQRLHRQRHRRQHPRRQRRRRPHRPRQRTPQSIRPRSAKPLPPMPFATPEHLTVGRSPASAALDVRYDAVTRLYTVAVPSGPDIALGTPAASNAFTRFFAAAARAVQTTYG